MKSKKVLISGLGGLAILVLSASTVIQSAGTYGWTGSPVDGGVGSGGQCSSCHNGGTSGVPTASVTSNPAFGGSGSNQTYVPGTTYTITIAPVGSYPYYGFNCEIINSQSATTSAVSTFGTFGAAVSSNCKIIPFTNTTPYPICASHNQRSASPFSFQWTAPASGTGYLYADVNGVNGNGATSGDQVSGVITFTLTAALNGIDSYQAADINLHIFPNPASDFIRLSYAVKEPGNVSVKLFNLNGELIADLFHEAQEAGLQNKSIQLPSGISKGVYLLKMSMNGKQVTEKIMIR